MDNGIGVDVVGGGHSIDVVGVVGHGIDDVVGGVDVGLGVGGGHGVVKVVRANTIAQLYIA